MRRLTAIIGLLAAQPWADKDRMAAGGGSYGGYLATLLLGRPHPFKTLIAHAAVYNFYTQYASDGGAERKRFGEFWDPGNVLQNKGIRSRLVHYPNENHWILKPQNSIHWYKTSQDWLKEFIGAGPSVMK